MYFIKILAYCYYCDNDLRLPTLTTYIFTAAHYMVTILTREMVHSNRHKSIVGRQFLYGCPAPSCTACASPYLLAFVPDLMDKSDEVATPHWVTYDVITVEPHGQTRQLASLP